MPLFPLIAATLAVILAVILNAGCADDTALPAPDDATAISDVDPATLEPFSFFVTSLSALRDLSNHDTGFGGDLRFGQADGLSGADAICATIAERSMTDASAKGWRAFLSTSEVDAIDRIGAGPWYDRLGRVVANDVSGLQQTRPDADADIVNDLPNEDGVGNKDPDGTGDVDNHHMITGSDSSGRLQSSSSTCDDWTSTGSGAPRVGLAWPRVGGGGGGGASNWLSALDESGCAPGVSIVENGASNQAVSSNAGRDGSIGSGGGYGGFYCFATSP